MTTIVFDYDTFIVQFPAFSNPTKFPEATLQMYWDAGTNYVSDQDGCGYLQGAGRTLALNLMTAHLTALSVVVAGGQVPGLVQAAGIDKVNVTLTPPPLKNQWQWWMSLTPYGQQLFALLQINSVGGFYIGGRSELAAFRRVGGGF